MIGAYRWVVGTSSLGRAWRALGAADFFQARNEFASVVLETPGHAEAWLGLTLALWRAGDRFAALGTARKTVTTDPTLLDAQLVLGAIQRQIGDIIGAVKTLEAARHLDPENPETLRHLSDIYRRARRPEDALETATLALKLEPESIQNLVSLGDALLANELLAGAERAYRVALALNAREVRAVFGLGRVALLQADWPAAQRHFERALAISPGDQDVHYNLALLHLRSRRYREGFAAYPAIMDTDSDSARFYYHHERVPLWSGEAINGRRLLISSDGGLGDHLMMARFFQRLPTVEPPVVVETPPPLLALFQRNFANIHFERFSHWRTPNTIDVHLPIMQLPCVFNIARSSDISGELYLHPDPEKLRTWRARLSQDPTVRNVGIVWRGNPQTSRDRWRSAPLRHWAPLAKVPGVAFHSLQYDATEAEIAAAPFPVVPTHLSIGNMDDTAALMTALDAIISVDTSTIHLAGGLGRPTWLANSLVSDFRWEIDRIDSPWYSSIRVVRQTVTDDWEPVFRTIASELAAFCAEQRL
jgi:tetratricopeptide (TPR) repeat protein